MKQQQTNQGVTYLRETRSRPEADIFWVSAVDAFQTLKSRRPARQGRPAEGDAGAHAREGRQLPAPRSRRHYWGFAVSGYGLMWNTRYLALHKLPAAARVDGPGRPALLRATSSISAPSRSGTTHLTVEVILQAYGWEKGWALLLQMGGNMGAITERSFGVPEAVVSGQYGIGVVIDFFGLSAIASGQPIDFAYPSLTSVVPASVAVVKNGPNPANARAFVEYLLWRRGAAQALRARDRPAAGGARALRARAPRAIPTRSR